MIYEVFRQERKGQAFAHAGSLPAPDMAFAEVYAREQYGRRGESVALWVVPRDQIQQIDEFVDELERNYHRVDGYPLKAKLKEARERAGTASDDADVPAAATHTPPPPEPGSARREANGG